jgi:hypothetical protein
MSPTDPKGTYAVTAVSRSSRNSPFTSGRDLALAPEAREEGGEAAHDRSTQPGDQPVIDMQRAEGGTIIAFPGDKNDYVSVRELPEELLELNRSAAKSCPCGSPTADHAR